MGGLVSNIRKKDVQDDEEEIRKYEEATENDPYNFAFENQDDREIKWYQYLLYDIRFRIAYALAIAILVGLVLPLVVYFAFFNKDDTTIYGSCLLNENARFQCLVNNFQPADEASCIDAHCCWEENDQLLFKCFHSFPSAYQYQVSDIRFLENESNQTDPGGNVGKGVEIQIQPNHPELMSALTIRIKWIDENHLNIQMFNPKYFPEKVTRENVFGNLKMLKSEMDAFGVEVNYGTDEYFFLRLGRNGSQETIFDTRLGPISGGNGFITFTTTLPTPYFYGLRGGEGIESKGTLTYGAVNGFENHELPFYMSCEESGGWHGVLLDTTNPFMVQVVQAPGIMFHVEGPAPEINLNVFTGSSKEQVLQQLHKHIAAKEKLDTLPYAPPYWGLGLHLCHKSPNGSMALEHIKALHAITYDSDCIDEDLLRPFGLDHDKFSTSEIDEIVEYLINNATKKIVLNQKLGMKWNEMQILPIKGMLVMDKTNASNIHPFAGVIDNQTVYYPDVFHPDFSTNLTLWGFDFGSIPFSGLILGDNFPINENATTTCNRPDSFLQNLFLSGSSISNLQNGTLGSICPNMVHTVSGGESSPMATTEKTHLELHNLYGLEAMKKLSGVTAAEMKIQNRQNESFLLSGDSSWTESLYYGMNGGMKVPATWIGLRESLAHSLRNFVLSPFMATPICGYLHNESSVLDPDLCLRWYQVGLLLPFAYHSYGHGNVSRGPLDFNLNYQGYLNTAIKQRYSYAPYYYTLSRKYLETFVPPISPMSYYFNDKAERQAVFRLVDQFMIGEALLAAPIVTSSGLNRLTYFPPGIWYEMDGHVAWNDMKKGGSKTVTGHISQSPLFLRGGHILPTLQNPEGSSILESRKGNYTLLIALLPNNISSGVLHLDDGVQANSVKDVILFEVTNDIHDSDIQLNFTITSTNLTCEILDDNISKRVDQIRILGFPIIMSNITLTVDSGPGITSPLILLDEELDMLRAYNLNLDWCKYPNIHITISAFKDVS